MQLHHIHIFDLFYTVAISIIVFVALMNIRTILVFCDIFMTFLIDSVQNIFSHVIIRMNGGDDHGKKQGNFKRTRTNRRRR